MNGPSIYTFTPPRTPLGRALMFVGLVALVVASFFVGIFVLAVALGVTVVMMLIRAVRRRIGSVPQGGGSEPRTFEAEVVVVEEPKDELERDNER